MATRTKEPPETEEVKEEPKDESEVVTKSNIREILEELLPGMLKGEEPVADEEPEKATKRPTARDEEARTYDDVKRAVKEFLASDEAKPEKDDTKEPEKVPGTKAVRWVEKYLWGAE